jgi:flagellar basal-body rod protein FlgG
MLALDIAATGMQAQQTNVEVIANNIANMTTTGFKGERVEFQDLLYQDVRQPGSNSTDSGTIVPSGTQLGLGVKTAGIYRTDAQGNLAQTGNTLDMAIDGHGWFQITQPDGSTAYTRDGTFSLAPDGTIVTADGYVVQPGLQVPANASNVTINASGQVEATIQGQTAPTTIGQLQLATFPNDAGLSAQGGNLFVQTAASGDPVTGVPDAIGFGSVMQGYLENSNVNVVSEMTNLISAQRAYEMNSQVITTSNQMLSTLTQLR